MRGISKHLARDYEALYFDKEERTDEKDIEQCVVLRVYVLRRKEAGASGSVGGVRPCQGRGRGFESRLALFYMQRRS